LSNNGGKGQALEHPHGKVTQLDRGHHVMKVERQGKVGAEEHE
jgi:hypothetical protein